MPDWSLLQTPNFAQAALSGFQVGQEIGRQRRSEAALKGYILNPDDPESLNALVLASPDVGLRERERRQKLDQQRRIGELARKAAAGDDAAAAELWSLDADIANRFDKQQQDMIKQGTDAIANAALGIAMLPEKERAAAWDQRIDYLSQTFPNLARYKGQYSPENLEGIIDQTGIREKVNEARRVRWVQRPGEGGALFPTDSMGNIIGGDPGAQPKGGDPAISGPAGAPPPTLPPDFDFDNGGPTPTASGGFPR